MGWANCGTDSNNRKIGYAIRAECDQPGCTADIDRGVAYACGGMHGEGEFSCEQYFCEAHLHIVLKENDGQLCPGCFKAMQESSE